MDRTTQEASGQARLDGDPRQADCWGDLGELDAAQRQNGRSAGRRQADAAGERMAQLALTIEREIIPRLMLAHRQVPREAAPPPVRVQLIGDAQVRAFAKLVLAQDESLAMAYVETLRAGAMPVDLLYLELLGPTAQYLGQLWEQDLCDFTDVTVGLGRLQRVMRELSPAFGQGVEHPANGRRVLLLPSPGEQHTFGLVMVGEFFRRAGWDVSGGAWESGEQAPGMVAAEWFDVLGLSLGAEIHLDALARCIDETRQSSRNRAIAIMVGGPIFIACPELVRQVGADAMAVDGKCAPVLAEEAIGRLNRHARQSAG